MKSREPARRQLLAVHEGGQLGSRVFLAEVGTAAALAGRQGGHLCAPVNEGSLHSGDAAAAAVARAEARRKGRCSVPRVLGRILRKQQGRNKRHWLLGTGSLAGLAAIQSLPELARLV